MPPRRQHQWGVRSYTGMIFFPVLIAPPADVGGRAALFHGPVLNAHLPTTDAAIDDPLQKGPAFPRHTSVLVVAPVLPQLLLVLHEFLPTDIGRMMLGDSHGPLCHVADMDGCFAGLR